MFCARLHILLRNEKQLYILPFFIFCKSTVKVPLCRKMIFQNVSVNLVQRISKFTYLSTNIFDIWRCTWSIYLTSVIFVNIIILFITLQMQLMIGKLPYLCLSNWLTRLKLYNDSIILFKCVGIINYIKCILNRLNSVNKV